jgi:hypothetical protein
VLAGVGGRCTRVVIVGTFARLWQPSLASALVRLAALATPLLAILAAVGVARGRRALLLTVALALLTVTAIGSGPVSQLSSSIVTALGSLTVGVALTRLIPRRWLLVVLLISWARARPRVAASRGESFPAGPESKWAPAPQTKAADSGIFPAAMCDHLCDTVTRYDRDRKRLMCLLVCAACRTQTVVETLAYEPNFSCAPLPNLPGSSSLAVTTLDEQRKRRAVREEGLRFAA